MQKCVLQCYGLGALSHSYFYSWEGDELCFVLSTAEFGLALNCVGIASLLSHTDGFWCLGVSGPPVPNECCGFSLCPKSGIIRSAFHQYGHTRAPSLDPMLHPGSSHCPQCRFNALLNQHRGIEHNGQHYPNPAGGG